MEIEDEPVKGLCVKLKLGDVLEIGEIKIQVMNDKANLVISAPKEYEVKRRKMKFEVL